jgi:hypothetical protein
MKTKRLRGLIAAGVGALATHVAAAPHKYGAAPQTGEILGMLKDHPILNASIQLLFLGMALSLGAVIIAALVKPPTD